MKPIILNMDEMSDSMEMYRAKPKSMVVYSLYVVFVLMIVVGIVTCFLRMDNVVKGNGVLRDSEAKDDIKITSRKISNCSVTQVDNHSSDSGMYVVSGNTIKPKRQGYSNGISNFHVELYISSYDIGEIKDGQEVKFSLAAYPANKYGYCKGVVCNVSKDAVVDAKVGASYYVVTVRVDNIVDDAKKKNMTLRNGMPCRGNIVVGKKTIMNYILEKI